MTFDDLPEAARKVLALRATFQQTLGFDDGQVFIGPAHIAQGPPAPADHVWLAAVISLAGDQRKPDFCAIGGVVPAAWDIDLMIPAWNLLDQDQRNSRLVSEDEVTMMALSMTSRGIVPPSVLRGIWLEPPTGRN